ncbi:MAG: F0F1 ATP synthase subunit delta [Longicatena sp.]|jgi:F-type H+-transporting ATPase subunit delta|uniref:F0F1 ATP synthase subunit delta n=1 Tax=Anaerorhabdus sp. TaxID=1872524 RepID=UPI002FCABE2A
MDQLADRYGTALFELAMEENKLDEWQKDGKLIQTTLTPDMNGFFLSEQITKDEKKDVLVRAFKDAVNPKLLDFMCLLVDNQRFTYVNSILISFNSLCNQSKNIKEGLVYSARPLSESQIKEIEDVMSLKMNSKCELINRIDPRLLSGFKVVIDNEVIDTSMKNKIQNMKTELLKGTR